MTKNIISRSHVFQLTKQPLDDHYVTPDTIQLYMLPVNADFAES
jgi:hypothetical protein